MAEAYRRRDVRADHYRSAKTSRPCSRMRWGIEARHRFAGSWISAAAPSKTPSAFTAIPIHARALRQFTALGHRMQSQLAPTCESREQPLLPRALALRVARDEDDDLATERESDLQRVWRSRGHGEWGRGVTKKGTKRKIAPRTKGPCEHGVKYRSKCKVCRRLSARASALCTQGGGASICEHGRRRLSARSAGASICKHDRVRSRCKECGGGSIAARSSALSVQGVRWVSICEHGRVRSKCKECGGSQSASTVVSALSARSAVGHQSASTVVSRSRCKECGGSQICEHGRERSKCKECGGSASICEHGRERHLRCKECGGASICEHGRRRPQCKECGGHGICEHGRQRSECKECGGSQICEHGRQRSVCKECGGSQICEHGRRRSECKECGGASICEHGRRRKRVQGVRVGTGICEHGGCASLSPLRLVPPGRRGRPPTLGLALLPRVPPLPLPLRPLLPPSRPARTRTVSSRILASALASSISILPSSPSPPPARRVVAARPRWTDPTRAWEQKRARSPGTCEDRPGPLRGGSAGATPRPRRPRRRRPPPPPSSRRRRRRGAAANARVCESGIGSAAPASTTPRGSSRPNPCCTGSRPTSTRRGSSRTSSGSSPPVRVEAGQHADEAETEEGDEEHDHRSGAFPQRLQVPRQGAVRRELVVLDLYLQRARGDDEDA